LCSKHADQVDETGNTFQKFEILNLTQRSTKTIAKTDSYVNLSEQLNKI